MDVQTGPEHPFHWCGNNRLYPACLLSMSNQAAERQNGVANVWESYIDMEGVTPIQHSRVFPHWWKPSVGPVCGCQCRGTGERKTWPSSAIVLYSSAVRCSITPVRGCFLPSDRSSAKALSLSSCLAHTGLRVCCDTVERSVSCVGDCGRAVRYLHSPRGSDARAADTPAGWRFSFRRAKVASSACPRGRLGHAGVPRSKAMVWWRVRGIVRVAAAGVNPFVYVVHSPPWHASACRGEKPSRDAGWPQMSGA